MPNITTNHAITYTNSMPVIWQRVWRPENSIYCLCTLLLWGMEEVNEGLATLFEFKDSLRLSTLLALNSGQ